MTYGLINLLGIFNVNNDKKPLKGLIFNFEKWSAVAILLCNNTLN